MPLDAWHSDPKLPPAAAVVVVVNVAAFEVVAVDWHSPNPPIFASMPNSPRVDQPHRWHSPILRVVAHLASFPI